MSAIGVPYHRFAPDEPYDAIVIGSGIGGLTVAALLAKYAGQKVLVLEQHYTAGGCTHVFRRNGFEWNIGVHYVGEAARVITDDVAAEPIEWASMGDVYDRIVLGEEVFELVAGRERFIERMTEYFPGEREAIEAYVGLVLAVRRAATPFFAERVLPAHVAAVLGKRMRGNFERFAARTTREVVEDLTANQKLVAVLTGQYGNYGLPPSQSSFAVHAMLVGDYLEEGGFFPAGGASRFAAAVVPTIERAGGRVVVRAAVTEVLVAFGEAVGVRLADGREIRARRVVSDAGIFNTFTRLLPPGTIGDTAALERLERGDGHIYLYVGLDRTAEDLALPKANYWLFPDEHHERNVAAWAANPDAPFAGVFLAFPSAKDPTFTKRFPGRATVDIITSARWHWFERWEHTRVQHRGAEYEALKRRFAGRLLECLYQRFPQTRGRVAHAELSTPLSTRHFTGWARGELYGLGHTPARFAARLLRPRTPLKNLFLTGQDVCTAGLSGAAVGAAMCASAILGRDILNRHMSRVGGHARDGDERVLAAAGGARTASGGHAGGADSRSQAGTSVPT